MARMHFSPVVPPPGYIGFANASQLVSQPVSAAPIVNVNVLLALAFAKLPPPLLIEDAPLRIIDISQ